MPGSPFLVPQIVQVPLAYGFQRGMDTRALPAPNLHEAKDIQFDEEGGIQQRLPYAAMSQDIVGGGTLSNIRRLGIYNGQLLAFSDGALYSYSASDDAWQLQQEHLATKVTEEATFVRSADQFFADRAELGGIAVTTWQEQDTTSSRIYVAVTDVETGTVLIQPTEVAPAGLTVTRPRVVAQSSLFLFSFFDDTNNAIRGGQIDPANLSTSIAALSSAPTDLGNVITATGRYDVVTRSNGDALLALETTVPNHIVVRVTNAFAVTRATKARTGTRIAVAISGNDTELHVIRYDGTNIRGDRINFTTLADVAVNTNMGTPIDSTVNQIAAAARSTANGGQFRTYAFWSSGESPDGNDTSTTPFATETNYIDTASAVGSVVVVARMVGVASRAFERDGRVYVWLVFAGESTTSGMGEPLGLRLAGQNGYYLYREEATSYLAIPHAKATAGVAGGFTAFSGLLPNVQRLAQNIYTWAGCERRVIPLNNDREDRRKVIQTAYADRGPRAIRLEFDSNEARRVVQLGRTLYIAGGIVSQYDGTGIAEVGFHVAPWYFQSVGVGGGGGVIPIGTYNVKASVAWPNAAGELDRSASVTGTALTTVSTGRLSFDGAPNLYVTAKKSPRHEAAIEFWRSQTNPPLGADMHLITSNDPAGTGDNRYIKNDPTAIDIATFDDNLTDTDLVKRERNPENGGVLENLPPPPATILAVTQDRLLAAGIADDPYAIAPSKLRAEGEVAAFHELLRFRVPPVGGRLTGVAVQSETIFAWAERATFAVPGDGFDNALGGENYGPVRTLSEDVGAVNQESIALTPRGVLFKSQKGWYLQPAGFVPPQYVGAAVSEFDDEEVVAVNVLDSQHHVRIVTTGRVLVWDYETNLQVGGAWAEWSFTDNESAVVWQGRHVLVSNSGEPLIQDLDWSSPGTSRAPLDIETAWIRREAMGWQKVWNVMVLGEYRGAHRLRVRLKYDYNETVVDDKYWTPSPAIVGRPLQVRHGPRFGWCEALKVRLTAEHTSLADTAPVGESLKLTSLALELGVEPGLFRGLPTAQKQ